MTAAEVKAALYRRHPALGPVAGPGAWTCLEEWRNIDLLAMSAWGSTKPCGHARVGYEVKVSRSDLRQELLNPRKRLLNVEWCNEFWLAVPKGLLTAAELAFVEPVWDDDAFSRSWCPNRRHGRCKEMVPVPTTASRHVSRYPYDAKDGYGAYGGYRTIECRVCGGRGYLAKSTVELTAPTVWVPADLGLIEVDDHCARVVKPAPRRKQVPALGPHELGQLVRWVSVRPDPRHRALDPAASHQPVFTEE